MGSLLNAGGLKKRHPTTVSKPWPCGPRASAWESKEGISLDPQKRTALRHSSIPSFMPRCTT